MKLGFTDTLLSPSFSTLPQSWRKNRSGSFITSMQSHSGHFLRLTNPRFVLTSKNYIRTVTQIKPEWLLEIAPIYYDLNTFQKGEVKSALERVLDKVKRQEAINGRSKGKNTKDK